MWLNFDDRKWLIFKRPLTNENPGTSMISIAKEKTTLSPGLPQNPRLSLWIPAALRRQTQILVRADLQRPFSTENGFDLCFALKGKLRSEKAMSNCFRENNLVPDA